VHQRSLSRGEVVIPARVARFQFDYGNAVVVVDRQSDQDYPFG
jgi:hypothetical protein